MLMELGNRKQYECFSCFKIWIRTSGNGDLRHVDPYAQWGATGEDEF